MGIKAAVFEIKATCYAHEGFNDESPSVQGAALEQLGKDMVDHLPSIRDTPCTALVSFFVSVG